MAYTYPLLINKRHWKTFFDHFYVLEDPKVVQLVKERDVVLEVCPISNWITGSVQQYRDHPVPKLIETGLKVQKNL
jgi:adenosine deaminase